MIKPGDWVTHPTENGGEPMEVLNEICYKPQEIYNLGEPSRREIDASMVWVKYYDKIEKRPREKMLLKTELSPV